MPRLNTLETLAVDAPRDCVIAFQVGTNRTLLVSYDQRGDIFEEFRTATSRATKAASDQMLERVREFDALRLRLA